MLTLRRGGPYADAHHRDTSDPSCTWTSFTAHVVENPE
jgi:hypothetical protein